MKSNVVASLLVGAGLLATGSAFAVPALQIGVSGGMGGYLPYESSSTAPNEADTAITSGTALLAAGVYQNNNVKQLGGQYTGGKDWGQVAWKNGSLFPTVFNDRGAVLLASVPDGSLASALASLTVNGLFAFHGSEDTSYFQNNHDPVKDAISDFLFFDIGNFAKNADAVPDFTSGTGAADGEIKFLTLGGVEGLAWIHFDLMALENRKQGNKTLVTTLGNNPGSHDATVKPEEGTPPAHVPERATPFLIGLGLMGWWLRRRLQKA